ncbi:hypothetical protein FOL47_001177, partial [Perkinsus chesapeaki]
VIGLLHDSNQLAAHVSMCNIFVIVREPLVHHSICRMFMLSYGLQTGLSAKVGRAVGASQIRLGKMYCKAAVVLGGSIILIAELILLLWQQSIVNFYTKKEPEVAVYASFLICPLLISLLPFDISQGCMQGVFKGLGIQRYAVPVNIFAYYIVMIPLGYVLTIYYDFGVYGMWMGFVAGAGTIAVSYFIILTRTNWTIHVEDAKARNLYESFT